MSVATLTLGLLGAGRFLFHAASLLTFPYDVANGEGLVLLDATRLAAGQAIYTSLDRFPLVVTAYPPVFATIAAGLVKLTGPTFFATRMVSALSTLAATALVALLVRRRGGGWMTSAACGMSYLSLLFVYEWGVWGRVDMLAVALSLSAVYVARRAGRSWIVLSAGLALLALFTKQTALAAPLAIALWLARRDARQGLGFVALVGGLGMVLLGVLNWATSGEALVHLVVYQVLPYFPRHLLAQWRALIAANLPLLLAAAGGSVGAAQRGREPDLPIIYLATSLLLTLSSGRLWSSSNFFLEPLAAAVVVAGGLWVDGGRAGRVVAPALLSMQILWAIFFRASPLHALYPSSWEFTFEPGQADILACQSIDARIRASGGSLLAEDAGWAVRHGRGFPADPLYTAELSALGRLPLRGQLLEAIDAGAFPLAILHFQGFDREVLARIQARYVAVDRARCVADYTLLVPR